MLLYIYIISKKTSLSHSAPSASRPLHLNNFFDTRVTAPTQ